MSDLPLDVVATEEEMREYMSEWKREADIDCATISLTIAHSEDIEDLAYALRPLIWKSSREFRDAIEGLRSGDAFAAARINQMLNDLMAQLGAIYAKNHPDSPKVFETNDDLLRRMSNFVSNGRNELGQF